MAQKTVVTLVSDLSGKDIDEGGQTVEFGLDGVTYEIDLNETEANELRDQLATFVEHGRRTGGRRSGRPVRSASARSTTTPSTPTPVGTSTAEREENKKIRAWAKEHGYQVSDRGRIPSDVAKAYRQAA